MSFDPLLAAFKVGALLIEKIWPDPTKQAEELLKLQALHQKGDLAALESYTAIMIAQIKVNEVSAGHSSWFIAGARPAAIWAGVFSMFWAGVMHPLLTWVWLFAQMEGNPPPLIESTALMTVVTGLLGVSTMRTVEKKHNTHKDRF